MTTTTVTETRQVSKTRVVSITCDFCKKTVKVDEKIPGSTVGEMSVSFGYGSKHDITMFTADVCEDCFDKMREQATFQSHEIIM